MTLRRAPTLNLPNQLTVLRLGMCGLLLISLSFAWPYAATTAFLIFTLASLNDWLDGAIARSRNLVTDLGKLLDPLADKILILGTLVGLVERHVAPMWMVVIIMAREFLITGLRTIAAHKQIILSAERVGKHKTLSQIVAILVSLAYLSLGEFGLQNTRLAYFFWRGPNAALLVCAGNYGALGSDLFLEKCRHASRIDGIPFPASENGAAPRFRCPGVGASSGSQVIGQPGLQGVGGHRRSIGSWSPDHPSPQGRHR